ncbi:Delta(24(24(1)))-sterol reductase [Trichinella pseudospiralis]
MFAPFSVAEKGKKAVSFSFLSRPWDTRPTSKSTVAKENAEHQEPSATIPLLVWFSTCASCAHVSDVIYHWLLLLGYLV